MITIVIDTTIGGEPRRLAISVLPDELEDVRVILIRGGATIVKETTLEELK